MLHVSRKALTKSKLDEKAMYKPEYFVQPTAQLPKLIPYLSSTLNYTSAQSTSKCLNFFNTDFTAPNLKSTHKHLKQWGISVLHSRC